LSYAPDKQQTDKQTNKQTGGLEHLPTSADSVTVGNKVKATKKRLLGRPNVLGSYMI